MKILEIFEENRLKFVEKMKDHRHLKKDFHWAGKVKKAAGKILRVWTKNEENFEKVQANFENFDQNLYGELTFSTFFTKYFLDFWLLSQSLYLSKITPDFYNNFSDFGGGGRSGAPHPRRYCP